LTAEMKKMETAEVEDLDQKLEEEEEDSLPGFGAFASLLALTLIVLTRRKD